MTSHLRRLAAATLLIIGLLLGASPAQADTGNCRVSYSVPSMSAVEMTNDSGQVVRLWHSESEAHTVWYRYLDLEDKDFTMRVRERQAAGDSTGLPRAPGLSLVLRSSFGTEIWNGSVRSGTRYRVGIQACGGWEQTSGTDLSWRAI